MSNHRKDLEESRQGSRAIRGKQNTHGTSNIWHTCKMRVMCRMRHMGSIHSTYGIQDTRVKWGAIIIRGTRSVNRTHSIRGTLNGRFTRSIPSHVECVKPAAHRHTRDCKLCYCHHPSCHAAFNT